MVQKKKRKGAHTSARLGCHFSFGAWGAPFPSASVMKESVSHTGAVTRAESPPLDGALTPVGDEDCNSRRDPPFTNDSPSHGKGPNQGR